MRREADLMEIQGTPSLKRKAESPRAARRSFVRKISIYPRHSLKCLHDYPNKPLHTILETASKKLSEYKIARENLVVKVCGLIFW